MTDLYWKLSILSKSVEYKNLTGASQHVGVSQPQLSRIVTLLESELEISLLDRSSPRHSTWTTQAKELSEIFKKNYKSLNSALLNLKENSLQKEVSIGCLEGLSYLAKNYAHSLLQEEFIHSVTLDIYDINQLEAKFMSMDLDLIFCSRFPKIQKYNQQKILGYQSFTSKGDPSSHLQILSTFENTRVKKNKAPKGKTLVSNSLFLRKNFQDYFGGHTLIPSPVAKEKKTNQVEAILLAQNHFPNKIWESLLNVTSKKFKP